jgi:hypothetical protein
MIDQEDLGLHASLWPVKACSSRTRDLTEIMGPPKGSVQMHLVCWKETGTPGIHCGQTVAVLRLGRKYYSTSVHNILAGIRLHIAQCHREVLKDV